MPPIMEAMSSPLAPRILPSLSAEDVSLLECEREIWGAGSAKEQAVFERFGLSVPAYYQRLYQLCQGEAARAYDAVLVGRILEVADQLTTARLRRQGVVGG